MGKGAAAMNQTILLALLTKCRQAILKEIEQNQDVTQKNATTTVLSSTTAPPKTTRQSYDNAYFYILFVMFFYSFLAVTLLKGLVQHDKAKKDPYEEFMAPMDSPEKKYKEGPFSKKIDFEEENTI